MFKYILVFAFFIHHSLFSIHLSAQTTEKLYLSGTGSDQTVQWDFFCTGGMNANKWTKIAVPSCWELQGFGKYDYGFAKDSVRGKEKGLYKHRFSVPTNWKGKVINIVFEGVMTDAEVKVNGKVAGAVHQGAFYAFKYDISKLLNYGKENFLEVTVAKHSTNQSVNEAERKADFWIFGGIFRPVWLEVLPAVHIEDVRIKADANGNFTAIITGPSPDDAKRATVKIFDPNGVFFGNAYPADVAADKNIFLVLGKFQQPKLWTPETPYLYKAVFTIYKKGKPFHVVEKKFGFRTVEVKQRDGIYVNGVKVKMKGVNRHAFRPETGRTTSKQISIEDVLLMKEMNMNAVRMSHYPPDDHFLDVCDSIGLFVMDELAGWHGHYDERTGKKLVKEMIDHDVNHPSIIIWANGNEGGHNLDLDKYFSEFDIQKRPVVHPWQLFGGFDTQHYREYNYGIGNYENGKEIVLPTEFLHGQFDGGHGAGIEDYWEKMWHNPLSAGGFLWDFADNAVVRKDKNDSLDTDKHRAADGIVGPHHEKEASFYTIKEVWSPVYFERREIAEGFDGKLNIENRYHYTNTKDCSFSWKLKRFDITTSKETEGKASAPDIQPVAKGFVQIPLPADWKNYDVLYVTVKDRTQKELFTWSFPISSPATTGARMIVKEGNNIINTSEADSLLTVTVKDIIVVLNKKNGLLVSVKNAKGELPFNNGPVLQEGINNFKGFKQYKEGNNVIIESSLNQKESYNTLKWTIYPSGWVQLQVNYFPAAYFTNFAGINFSFPEKEIQSVTYMGDGPYRVWKNRLKGNQFGVWSKTYNNTETGEAPWIYPEFKGYHSNFYGGYFFTKTNRFTVVTENEGLFLRLFTPAWKTDQWHNYEPLFPSGDISFMQGISSIGSKTQRNETTGPMGSKNIFYDYEKDPARALHINLYFNFSAQ
ncbi:glycoside hydrolase family 2 protein [Lacibacter sediminis]|uniref:beta-galactosidase n=1 Tax=Lacibacter sediminis TaxID=2760713 RepID=A0A7G5XJN7_9BACT|nr:glycoside hydrolase family 2 TIM barrel-domain containing protein [Lacibacter sediminis]QNA45690.1 glycoside hydrolase family 2 [Lacibacter sediminis]